MTENLPSVMYFMRSTNILQSNINLAFSYSNKMMCSFDETPSRAISWSLGIWTMVTLWQGVQQTCLENCFQQMHFITQLHLFLELVLHIYELVRRTCSSSFCFFLSSLCYPCLLVAFLEVLALVFYQLPCPQKWLVHFWNLPLANSPPSSSWLPY